MKFEISTEKYRNNVVIANYKNLNFGSKVAIAPEVKESEIPPEIEL